MITLYSTGCPKCKVLEKKLNAANIEYNICEDIQIMTDKNFTNLPVLEIGGAIKTFKEAVDWINKGGK